MFKLRADNGRETSIPTEGKKNRKTTVGVTLPFKKVFINFLEKKIHLKLLEKSLFLSINFNMEAIKLRRRRRIFFIVQQ